MKSKLPFIDFAWIQYQSLIYLETTFIQMAKAKLDCL